LNETQPAAQTMDGTPEPKGSVFRSPFLWAFLGGIILLTLIRPMMRNEPAPPPVLGQLPEFSLTAASGAPFGSADLAGQVYVTSFFFTRCPSICPRLTAAMGRLQQRYDEEGVEGVHLVSISVDPDYDRPERLREYGTAHGVDTARWTLLTGELEDIRQLVLEGFRTPLGEPDPSGNLVDIAHSTRFVLVDGSGNIRGYYDNDATGLDEIFHRSQHVLKEMRR
jgi:protein SCO1/2